MHLEQLQAFVKIVQLGSFTRAAEALGGQKSHLSRLVTQLEAQLGVKLLERTTRSLSTTEMGREVYERAVGILAAVEDTERVAQQHHGEPRGTLRMTCGVEFGMVAVSDWMNEYLARYPKVRCEVDYTSRVLDLVHDGYDLAIRVGDLDDSGLAARLLGELSYGLFACPHYIKRQGMPSSIEELKRRDLLMFVSGAQRSGWHLVNGDERARIDGPARLRCNNSFAVRHAILRSLGVGQLPLILAEESLAAGRMVPVLPGWARSPAPVHAVYASSRYVTPKVRAFIDMAVERFPREGPFSSTRAALHRRR